MGAEAVFAMVAETLHVMKSMGNPIALAFFVVEATITRDDALMVVMLPCTFRTQHISSAKSHNNLKLNLASSPIEPLIQIANAQDFVEPLTNRIRSRETTDLVAENAELRHGNLGRLPRLDINRATRSAGKSSFSSQNSLDGMRRGENELRCGEDRKSWRSIGMIPAQKTMSGEKRNRGAVWLEFAQIRLKSGINHAPKHPVYPTNPVPSPLSLTGFRRISVPKEKDRCLRQTLLIPHRRRRRRSFGTFKTLVKQRETTQQQRRTGDYE
ncbi:hypothetical protein MA16_Dca007503 [Dendrobium catenatum]|uniref:Uncharacterized protein n=1 Tax=Dendrobium catenatum TaxID=906689 RepID=A0A2I0WBA7_9ASPA|nr:hypothetical protein MA16_Dca007503 [Dendrobium catenatum]